MLEYVGTGIRVRWNAGLAAAARRRVRRLAATTSETGDRTRERPFDEREFRRDVLSIFGRTAGPSANRHWTGVRKNTNLTHSLALAKRDVCLSYSFSLSREREREREGDIALSQQVLTFYDVSDTLMFWEWFHLGFPRRPLTIPLSFESG